MAVEEMLDEDKELVDSLEGIMLTEYFPKDGKGQSYDDIKKIHYETVDKNGQWFSMWCWKPLGCAKPEPISPRVGIRVIPIDSIKVSIEEAIEEFHRGDWGSYFVDRITLSWPLYPGCDEPAYLFQSDLGVYVHIGAYTKNVNYQKADSNEFIIKDSTSELGAAHGATLIIKNFSDYDMELDEDSLKACHGKISTNPPSEITNKNTGQFIVAPTGLIGPKGWLEYHMAVNGKVETFRIFWDHPYGSGTSRYEYSMEPYAIEWEQEPQNPKGTEQAITVTLKRVLVNTPSQINKINCDH